MLIAVAPRRFFHYKKSNDHCHGLDTCSATCPEGLVGSTSYDFYQLLTKTVRAQLWWSGNLPPIAYGTLTQLPVDEAHRGRPWRCLFNHEVNHQGWYPLYQSQYNWVARFELQLEATTTGEVRVRPPVCYE